MNENRVDKNEGLLDEGPHSNLFAWTFVITLITPTGAVLLYVAVFSIAILDGSTNTPVPESGMSALVVALFATLITGIVVFMTFRIDRDAKREARETANEIALEVTKDVKKTVRKSVKRAQDAVQKAEEARDYATEAQTKAQGVIKTAQSSASGARRAKNDADTAIAEALKRLDEAIK